MKTVKMAKDLKSLVDYDCAHPGMIRRVIRKGIRQIQQRNQPCQAKMEAARGEMENMRTDMMRCKTLAQGLFF